MPYAAMPCRALCLTRLRTAARFQPSAAETTSLGHSSSSRRVPSTPACSAADRIAARSWRTTSDADRPCSKISRTLPFASPSIRQQVRGVTGGQPKAQHAQPLLRGPFPQFLSEL